MTLRELALKHGSDKAGWHEYVHGYEQLLKGRPVKRLLEIGIGTPNGIWVMVQKNGVYHAGASLRMWRDYFPEAQIFGFDINPKALIHEERITSILADQNDFTSLHMAVLQSTLDLSPGDDPRFDVIIDDGSHRPDHQIFSMQSLLPMLAVGGVYIIEDIYFVGSEYIVREIPPGYNARIILCPADHPPGYLLAIEREGETHVVPADVRPPADAGDIDGLARGNATA